MLSRARKFLQLSGAEKRLFLRAWLLLGRYRAATLLRPFKHLARHLEHHPQQPEAAAVSEQQLRQARTIGRLVAQAASHTPWKSPCLTQVLVVQKLLAERRVPGQFYLGVRKGCPTSGDPDKLAAHAWLQCGDVIINGERACDEFAVVSAFSWGGEYG